MPKGNKEYYSEATIIIPEKIIVNAVEYTVTGIGNNAFNTCKSLTSIIIPNSVTSIGEGAFAGCKGLTSITIPNSVISIGKQAFLDCTGLTAIKVDGNNKHFSSDDGVLFDKYKTTLIKYPIGKRDTSYKIPDSVTDIGERAFENCKDLTSITIPNSVTTIGEYAFNGCTSLTSITIPNSVTSIGEYAFNGCKGLTSITIPNSVISIGEYAFSSCTSLTSITIPDSVTTIGEYTFSGCTSLTSITIPDNVTSIGDSAFAGCKGLKSIAIPTSVKTIGNNAFLNCDSTLTALIYGTNAQGNTTLADKFPNHIFLAAKPEFGVNNITSNSVTLNVIPNANAAADNSGKEFTAQYRVKDETWQPDAPEFTGLKPNTEYIFEVGFFDDADTEQAVYELAPVKTLAADMTLEAEDITQNSITLKPLETLGSGIIAKYCIKQDGNVEDWQTNPKFEGLTSGTTYTFEAKYFVGNKDITDVITADIKTLTPYTPPANPTIDITGKEGGTVIYDRIKHTVTITPNDNYLVKEITLNGTTIPVTDGAMVLENIYGWSRISVTFEPKPEPAFEPDKYISELKFKANSSKTSKGNIRIKVNSVTDDNGNKIDLAELKDKGYTVKYKYYRSTQKASKYTAKVEKDADINSYINTSGKKGTKYYYKVRAMVYDADGSLVAKSDLKQCSYAARTWSK